ncbi:hypothetical protein N9224_02050 [Akkermansiaceae bacterium]|nr:hypothetical protein [Akkermansiaceae bacterium]
MRIFCLALLLLPGASSAIVIANYTDDANLRFHSDPAFIGNPYDWSGVGRTSVSADNSVNKEWATLLGENYFISAVHYHPSTGDTITFRGSNLISSPTFNYTVAGGFSVPGTDLWIGYTAGAMSPTLKRYAFNTTSADNLSETGLVGSTLLINGDNVAAGPGTITDSLVGTNQAEAWIEGGSTTIDSTPSTVDILTTPINFDTFILWENHAADTANNVTAHEALVQSGDSGSPAFQIVGGNLEIAGIAYSVFTGSGIAGDFDSATSGDEPRLGSVYSYTGSYETPINNTIALVPLAVPESGTLSLLALASLGLMRRRALN